MSFPRYPNYKRTHSEWLTFIPEHWDMGQSRRRFRLRNEPAKEGDEQLTASQKHGIIRQAEFIESEGRRVVEVIKGQEILKHVEPGDFVISMRSFQGGLEYSRVMGCISSAYVMLAPVKQVNPAFFTWLFKSQPYIQALQSTTNLVRDGQALRFPNFCQVDIPIVPGDEQLAIASFLERETAKIDALIAEQQRLIELLQEKRQAVISHAVTKGLNPNVPMKDSGVEWLGEVPEHWEVRPLKSEVFFQEGPGIMAVDFMDEGIPLLRVSCVQGEQATLEGCNYLDPRKVAQKWSHFVVCEGDLLLSGSASLGGVSEVGKQVAGSIPYTGLIRIRPLSTRISWDFIKFLIESSVFSIQIDMLKAGATIQHFGPTHLRQMRITLPPPGEQELITQELGKAKTAFDALVENAKQAVSLLKERRSALISAAVTGQIDVRGLATEEETA